MPLWGSEGEIGGGVRDDSSQALALSHSQPATTANHQKFHRESNPIDRSFSHSGVGGVDFSKFYIKQVSKKFLLGMKPIILHGCMPAHPDPQTVQISWILS